MAFFKKKQNASSKDHQEAANTNSVFSAEMEERIQSIGTRILNNARNQKQNWLSTAFWSDKLMDWAMEDENFKIQLFRFIDTFPTLKTPEQVHDHLLDYLTQPNVKLPPGMGLGLKAGGIMQGTMTKTVTKQIKKMAENYTWQSSLIQ